MEIVDNVKMGSDRFKQNLVLKQRKIVLNEDVSPDSVIECMYYLYRLIEFDKSEGCKKPIELLINTNGGYVYDGLALVGLIEQMVDDGYEIVTTTIGKAFSMGFLISIVGSKRRAYRYATYMNHDVGTGIQGKLQDIIECVEETERLRKIGHDIIIRRTNITEEDLKKVYEYKLDQYYSAEEALSAGIIDEIL